MMRKGSHLEESRRRASSSGSSSSSLLMRSQSTVGACLASARAQASLLSPSRPFTPASSLDRESFGNIQASEFGAMALGKKKSKKKKRSSNRPRESSKSKSKSARGKGRKSSLGVASGAAVPSCRKLSEASDDSGLQGWSSGPEDVGGIEEFARLGIAAEREHEENEAAGCGSGIDGHALDDKIDQEGAADEPYALRALAMDHAHKTLDEFSAAGLEPHRLLTLCDELWKVIDELCVPFRGSAEHEESVRALRWRALGTVSHLLTNDASTLKLKVARLAIRLTRDALRAAVWRDRAAVSFTSDECNLLMEPLCNACKVLFALSKNSSMDGAFRREEALFDTMLSMLPSSSVGTPRRASSRYWCAEPILCPSFTARVVSKT